MGVIAVAVIGTGKKKTPPKAAATSVSSASVKTSAASSSAVSSSGYKSTDTALENIPASYLPLILEVSAVGGGGTGEKREFVIDMKLGADDQLFALKANPMEITTAPGYLQGATDRGLRVSHANAYMDIIPVFEGTGFALPKKIATTAVKSQTATAKLIRRISLSELPVDAAWAGKGGFVYTTQYAEGAQSCSSFGDKAPACISGGLDIEPKAANAFSATCYGEKSDVLWCDSIIQSLSFKNNEVASSSSAGN
jgi:hypothetical protein